MQYEGKTIIGIAKERGSKSKTRAGAWKYLLTHLDGSMLTPNSNRWDWDRWRDARRNRTADGRARTLGYNSDDPNTPGRIWDRALAENSERDRRDRTRIMRDSYGALWGRYDYGHHQTDAERAWWPAQDLIREAVARVVLPAAYDNIEWYDYSSRRRSATGDALHHEVNDFRADAVVLCLRRAEGGKYGVKTTSKRYVLIERAGDRITTTETREPIAKIAKAGATYGSIIAKLKGEPGAATVPAPPLPGNGICYKQLAIDDRGRLASIYDASPWLLGISRHDPARRDHNGGLYVYETLHEARNAEFPDRSILGDADKVIVKCRCSGIYARYGNKLAFSSVTPLSVAEICE